MDFRLVFNELLRRFDEQKIRFALIGGFALHVAGFTRATDDVDFMIESDDLVKIKDIMSRLGYEVTHESVEFSNYWHPMAPLGCVDYLHAHRSYTRAMLTRAMKQKILDDFESPVLIPEDIIGLKIQAIANNPQRLAFDMADIEYLLKANRHHLNYELVKEYFHLFNRDEEFNLLLKRVDDA